MRRAFSASVFLVLAVATGAAGCKSCDSSTAGDGGSSPTTSLTDKQAAQVLARVGDKTITLGDYTAALEHMDQFDRLRYQSPERRKELLDEMITVELLAQEATAKGYDKAPLAQQELRQILRDAMLAEARKEAPTPAQIPEADVKAWFEAHRAEYKDPERRRVSVVVASSQAVADDVLAQDKLRQKEDELIAELKKEVKVEVDEAAVASIRIDLSAPRDAGAK